VPVSVKRAEGRSDQNGINGHGGHNVNPEI
jgi:hypothetical protein